MHVKLTPSEFQKLFHFTDDLKKIMSTCIGHVRQWVRDYQIWAQFDNTVRTSFPPEPPFPWENMLQENLYFQFSNDSTQPWCAYWVGVHTAAHQLKKKKKKSDDNNNGPLAFTRRNDIGKMIGF